MKFQQFIFAGIRIIQVWISLKYTILNIIPKSVVTLQFLKFLIFQIKAYIQGFQMRYQSFLGHWYPNSYSWFSDSIDIPFVLITTVHTMYRIQISRKLLFCSTHSIFLAQWLEDRSLAGCTPVFRLLPTPSPF